VATQYTALIILLVYFVGIKKLHAPTWPGWSMSYITKKRLIVFLRMYLPAALQFGSEFWRFKLIGSLAAHLGDGAL
jgi:Na+-driven multidrug efflux pump